jgi:hypothetical protein
VLLRIVEYEHRVVYHVRGIMEEIVRSDVIVPQLTMDISIHFSLLSTAQHLGLTLPSIFRYLNASWLVVQGSCHIYLHREAC